MGNWEWRISAEETACARRSVIHLRSGKKIWVALSAKSKEEYGMWNMGVWGRAKSFRVCKLILNIFVFILKVMENCGSGLSCRRIWCIKKPNSTK